MNHTRPLKNEYYRLSMPPQSSGPNDEAHRKYLHNYLDTHTVVYILSPNGGDALEDAPQGLYFAHVDCNACSLFEFNRAKTALAKPKAL